MSSGNTSDDTQVASICVEKGCYVYRITLSPREAVHVDCERKFIKWLKRCTDAYVVAEYGQSKRHIHALVCWDERRQKALIQNHVWTHHVKPHHPTSLQRIAVLVNAAYNLDWYDEYLHKEDGVEVLLDNFDRERVKQCLPTLEQQDALVASKEDIHKGRAFHDHKMWLDLAGYFKVWYCKEGYPIPFSSHATPTHTLTFLNQEMLSGRMVVMVDPRKRAQKAHWLWRVVTGTPTPSSGDTLMLESM